MNLDFAKSDGLVTAVVQDHTSGRVLMVGYMNEEAFRLTVKTGFVTFYSRSRGKLWLKGESSGHRLVAKEISTDCDRDAVLALHQALQEEGIRTNQNAKFFLSTAHDDAIIDETLAAADRAMAAIA